MKLRSEQRLSARHCIRIEDYYRQPDPQSKEPGKASKYIIWMHKRIRRLREKGEGTIRVVLYARVSSYKQRRCGNLDHQLASLRRRVLRLGSWLRVEVKIVGEYIEDASGWELWKSGRPKLVKAAARAEKHDAVLVAMDTVRLVRNRHHQRGVLPTAEDFDNLCGLVGGIRLATLHNPDNPPSKTRSNETRRGHEARGASPGRPPKPGYKKRHKQKYLQKVLELHQEGQSLRQIEAETGVNYRTAGRWCSEERQEL